MPRHFVAGAYKVKWNTLELGYTEQGFEWVIQLADLVPIQEDRHGMAIIDGIVEQIESMFIRLESLWFNDEVWNAVLPMLHPGTGQIGTEAGQLIRQSGLAKPIVLEPMTGVAKADKYIYTFNYAYPVDPVTLTMAARQLRRVPAAFQIFPDVSDAENEAKWFDRSGGA